MKLLVLLLEVLLLPQLQGLDEDMEEEEEESPSEMRRWVEG